MRHFDTVIVDDFGATACTDFPFNIDEPVLGTDRQTCLDLPFVKDFLQRPEDYAVYRLTREWRGYEVGTILFYDHQEVFYVYRP
jgi:hypothetical protein